MEVTHNLIISFNGETYKKRTKNIAETIMALSPQVLFTEVYFTVFKGTGKNKVLTERKLNLNQGKNLFRNEDFRTIFINNLLLN